MFRLSLLEIYIYFPLFLNHVFENEDIHVFDEIGDSSPSQPRDHIYYALLHTATLYTILYILSR